MQKLISMKIRLAAELQKDSVVDGEGIRAVLWTQGCSHNCKGCHNPLTHSFDGGALIDIDEVKSWIDDLEGHQGITLSGGDPFFQARESMEIAKYAKLKKLDVWCYTGFTYEALIKKSKNDKSILEFLENIDVLVDGKFILEQKSLDILFRGSKNQRIIDVPTSLKEGKVSLVKKYYVEDKKNNPLKRDHMYI